MANSSRLKCAECVKQNKPCVNLSWESLDKTREEYRKKVEEDEEELSRVMARLLRHKKILQQAEERAKKKAECLFAEMDVSGELDGAEDCPAASATVGLSPLVWESLGNIDSMLGVSQFEPEVVL
jgi:hypothetical protein